MHLLFDSYRFVIAFLLDRFSDVQVEGVFWIWRCVFLCLERLPVGFVEAGWF